MENTLIVFIADHGDMMGDHGLLWKAFYTFQGCIRIPLIVAPPGGAGGSWTRGVRSESLASQVDLMPTALDLCGVREPGRDWATRPTPFERGSVQALQLRPGRSLRATLD